MNYKFKTLLMLFSFMKNSQLLEHQNIITIIKEFNLNNPYLIGSIDNKLELFKFLSKKGQFLNIHSRITQLSANEEITRNSIVFLKYQANMQLSFPKNPYWSWLLISNDMKFEELLNTVAIETDINQKVFILKATSYEIYEAYKINDVIVKTKLGDIDLISNDFKWQQDVNPDFVKRRSNFHGIVLNGMVGFWIGLDMFAADSSYKEKAPYFQNNETYLVNGFADGLIHDILMTLQDKLNFTTMLYIRKKDTSGGFIHCKNGTCEGTGLIGDIFFKRADIALAAFSMIIDRANYVDYLHPIMAKTRGIYIPISKTEKIVFQTYLAPFSPALWITLALTGITFAAWRFLLLKVHGSETIFGFDHIWTSFSGFFGGKPTPTPIDKKSSYKTMIMATLLFGTVIWVAYRAHLNAELAVYEKKYPFDDMESFSKTNWR